MKPTTIALLQKCKQEKKRFANHYRLRSQLPRSCSPMNGLALRAVLDNLGAEKPASW